MWETLERRYLWQSRWYSLRQDRVRTLDGHEFTYTIIDHPGAVWIVPLTVDGRVVLIRSYRYPVGEWCYELPAGGLEGESDPAAVARRELAEEIGGRAAAWRYVGRFYTSNGVSNEVAHVYLATDVQLGPVHREPTEQIEIHPIPWAEALHMARTGAISDGPSALALLWCEPFLQ